MNTCDIPHSFYCRLPDVLKLYFRSNKYQAFKRQMNNYGFKTVKSVESERASGDKMVVYAHDYITRHTISSAPNMSKRRRERISLKPSTVSKKRLAALEQEVAELHRVVETQKCEIARLRTKRFRSEEETTTDTFTLTEFTHDMYDEAWPHNDLDLSDCGVFGYEAFTFSHLMPIA